MQPLAVARQQTDWDCCVQSADGISQAYNKQLLPGQTRPDQSRADRAVQLEVASLGLIGRNGRVFSDNGNQQIATAELPYNLVGHLKQFGTAL